MQIRSFIAFLIVFIASPIALLASDTPLQDSVKTVYIKVVAAEKPKAVTMESYTESYTPKEIRSKPKPRKRSLAANTEVSDRLFPSPSSNAEKPVIEENNTTLIIKRKPQANNTKPNSPASAAPVVKADDTHEEIAQTQVTDDTDSTTGNNLKASKTYLWVGIVLVVVGFILGILFGKTALLVSIAGMIFVIIGYTIKS